MISKKTIREFLDGFRAWAIRSNYATREAEIQLARDLKRWGDMLMDHAKRMACADDRQELRKRGRGYYQKAAHIGRRHGLSEFMGAGY